MGGYYGSVQVRSEDHAAVRAIAEQVALACGKRMFISPVLDGWIGIYPQDAGHDEAMGRAIAERVGGFVLHVHVHHDDVMMYWFYRNGRLIDAYWSRPGFFDEGDTERQMKLCGTPAAFEPLIGERAGQLGEILSREEYLYTFEVERLEAFAEAIGIPNALWSYEMLNGSYRILKGDVHSARGGSQFEEIPAALLEADRNARESQVAEIATEAGRAMANGQLLMRDSSLGGSVRVCATAEGFLLARPDYASRTAELIACRAPWKKLVPVTQIVGHVTAIASDLSGRRVAVAGGDRVQVWQLDDGEWSRAWEIPERDHAVGIAISADGMRVAHLSRSEITVSDVAGRVPPVVLPARGARHLAIHPSGEWVAVAANTLGLIDLRGEARWRDIFLGGKPDPSIGVEAILREKLGKIDLAAIEEEMRKQIDANVNSVKKGRKRRGEPEPSEAELSAMRQSMQAEAAKFLQTLNARSQGRAPDGPPKGREPALNVGFTRDGKRMWCSTHGGLRVFDWAEVPRESGADLLTAWCGFDIARDDPTEYVGPIHAVVEEMEGRSLMFGYGPHLYRMELATGRTRVIARVPGDPMSVHLAMSRDGSVLASVGRELLHGEDARIRPENTFWDVWSLAQLREE